MDDSTASASSPERIGAYRIEKRLGHGGMGEVFLAWDDRLERPVAVKRIRHQAESANQRERFRREARSAARLSHSAIVQVHDLVSDDSGDAIVMEYVPGVTLAERLAAGPLRPAEAVRLGRQIAEGLAAAHGAGMIHRDLKAENVIVTPAGQAKILDFGLARPVLPGGAETELTQRGVLVGTYHAMSPEQAGGDSLDARSDLFSFGSLLYEMLTGRAPFRGANGLETIRRVLTETPPPLSAVLPDLPLALSDLLERLLAKDREARPHDAQEVIDALAQIEIRDTSPRFLGSVSDLQTGATTVDLLKVKALTRPPDAGGRSARFPRRVGWIAALLALAVAGAAAVYWARTAAVKPLRVAILPFELRPAGGRLDLAASGVMSSLLGSLSSLRGLAVVDPTQTRGNTPVEVAHILGADEVVAVTLESAEGTTARVTLRRVQGGDGQVLKSVTFQVPTDPDGLYSLAEGVASQVRSVYSGFALLPDAPRLEVRPEDYAVFVQAQSDLDSGRISVLPARARLEPILITSPHFLEARLLGVDLNFSLWRTGQDPGGLDKARELARQAEKIAPGDPRVLLCELKVALADGRSQAAEDLLDRFEALRPGDPEILARRAELVDRLGRLDEALAMQRTVASRVPSWKNLFYLARLEARSGHIEEARATLETLTRQAPRNFWVEMEVGDFELRNGDPARAEAIFQRLDTGRPPLSVLINLGFSRYLLGRYREAVAVYQRAAEISPENPDVLINLADAETEAGDLAAAAAHYRRLLKNLEAAAERGPGVGNDLLRAQCLARLGRGGEAVDLVQRVLRQNPTDVDSFYYAALVDALAGDRNAALSNAREALLRGCSPRWFDISAFASLREEPEIQTLLKRRRTSPATRIGPDRATESSPSRSSPH